MGVTELDPALDGPEEDRPLAEPPKKKRSQRKAGDPGTYTHKLREDAERRPVTIRCGFCAAAGAEWSVSDELRFARPAHEQHRQDCHQEELIAARREKARAKREAKRR